MVALLLQQWLNYGGLLSGRWKQRIALPKFSFSNVKGKNKKSVQRSHNDFLWPMKHDLEILSCENWRSCKAPEYSAWELHESFSQFFVWYSVEPSSVPDRFPRPRSLNSHSRVFVWMLESIDIVQKMRNWNEDDYLLTVQWRFVEGLRWVKFLNIYHLDLKSLNS